MYGKIYWSRNKGLPPGAWCLIDDQVAQLLLAVEEIQPCLHLSQKKGQGPEMCHYLESAGHPKLPWFSLAHAKTKLGFVCPHLGNLVSMPGYAPARPALAATRRPRSGAHRNFSSHVAACPTATRKREPVDEQMHTTKTGLY